MSLVNGFCDWFNMMQGNHAPFYHNSQHNNMIKIGNRIVFVPFMNAYSIAYLMHFVKIRSRSV